MEGGSILRSSCEFEVHEEIVEMDLKRLGINFEGDEGKEKRHCRALALLNF